MASTVLYSKVEEISTRFPATLQDLQQLFQLYGLPVAPDKALTWLAEQLRQNGSFRADTADLLRQVLLRNGEVSYLDLLGLVLVGAVGASLRTEAPETAAAARTLMPFLIEIRRSAERPEPSAGVLSAMAASERNAPEFAFVKHTATESAHVSYTWMVSLVVLALLAAVSWRWRMAAPPSPAPQQVAAGAPAGADTVPPARATSLHAAPRAPRPIAPARSATGAHPEKQPAHTATAAAPPEIAPRAHGTVTQAGHMQRVPRTSTPIWPAKRSASSGNIAAAHGTVLRAQVVPGVAGIMAANLLSSPAPPYPAQASAARVQGEVIIEAVVGKDGSVVDSRVVSGPPLLREAALSAVQSWRYRPFEVDGKPSEIATTARLDFRLLP